MNLLPITVKTAYDKIPKWLRTLSGIVLSGAIVYFLFSEGVINYLIFDPLPSNFQQRWIITVSITTIFILVVLLLHAYWQNKKAKTPPSQSEPNTITTLKSIDSPAYLDTIQVETFSWDVLVHLQFDPKIEQNPNYFSNQIFLSDKPVCSKCGYGLVDTWMKYTHEWAYECSGDPGHFQVTSNHLKDSAAKALVIAQGNIIHNFKDAWKKYLEELNRLTDGKPEHYRLRWNLHKVKTKKNASWLD